MKKELFLLLFGAFVLFACKGNDDEKTAQVIVPSGCTVSALTATISCVFNGLSIDDLAYGTFGIMYCHNNDAAESEFKSWKEGNDNPDCSVFKRGTMKSGGAYQAILENLVPDTEYSCCVFFMSEDKTRREIGAISTFRTQKFSPVIRADAAKDIMHYTATLCGNVTLSPADMKLCTIGFIMSDSTDVDVQNGTILSVSPVNENGDIAVSLTGLRAGHEYCFKIFVRINATDEYSLGTLSSFSTASPDDMAVDLGLSVKWADRDLGTDNKDERAPCYAWGHMVSYGTYFSLDVKQYKYWDSSNNCYIDIGDDISGTEYDVARYLLGGKWRMPTKKEVEELVTCKIETIWEGDYVVGFKFYGSNGNSIYMTQERRWTSTLSDYISNSTYNHVYPNPWAYLSWDGIEFFEDYNKRIGRYAELIIRPVCDY